uniref:Uncharacterized protein n=1 Tax=Rhizophora mucronata TaxID=61149 RepID=A0A2P2QNS9_RHIMU
MKKRIKRNEMHFGEAGLPLLIHWSLTVIISDSSATTEFNNNHQQPLTTNRRNNQLTYKPKRRIDV